MTWFGWIVLVCWVVNVFASALKDDGKTAEHKALEFIVNSLGIAGLVVVGTGHL